MNARCVYCGREFRPAGGEHVIPKALGGWKKLKTVCGGCNNRFSELDDELVRKSLLATAVADCLKKPHEVGWSSSGRIPNPIDGVFGVEPGQFRVWPQIQLSSARRSHPIIDREVAARIGYSQAFRVFVRCVRAALRRHEWGEKRKTFIHVTGDEASLNNARKVAPTVALRKPMEECDYNSTFHLIYADEYQKLLLFDLIDRFDVEDIPDELGLAPVENARIARICTINLVNRALVKISLNVLADVLAEKFASADFRLAIETATGKRDVNEAWMSNAGFCSPEALRDLHVPDCHVLELTNYGTNWLCFASWFGGKACTAVAFPGRQLAQFRRLVVQSTFRSGKAPYTDAWKVKMHQVVLARRTATLTWFDRNLALPHYAIEQQRSYLQIETVDTASQTA